jgi:hypothetical protein
MRENGGTDLGRKYRIDGDRYFYSFILRRGCGGIKPDAAWHGGVEVKRLNRFFSVGAQFVPCVALGENAFGEALGAKSTIGFLGYFEDDFVHFLSLRDWM